jgi:mono/diheme cytochrome c family protein
MQWRGRGIVVVWWVLLGAAQAAEQRPSVIPGEMMSEGPLLFVRYCCACHGVDGHGHGPAASAFQPPPADLTRIAQQHGGRFPVAEITAYINGVCSE